MERYEKFNEALEKSKGEREIGKFLKENIILIRNVLNEHSWNCVVCKPEFKIGAKYIADFIILSATSGYWNCVLIEMQSHRDEIFLKDGTASKGLREAQKQVQEWEMWIESYGNEFREYLADLVHDKPAQCSNVMAHTRAKPELRDPKTVIRFYYKILIGRRNSLDEDGNQRRNYFKGIDIVTFDRLLDYAKYLDENEMEWLGEKV